MTIPIALKPWTSVTIRQLNDMGSWSATEALRRAHANQLSCLAAHCLARSAGWALVSKAVNP
jgi:hypothetical protein